MEFILNGGKDKIFNLVNLQLNNFFGMDSDEFNVLEKNFHKAIEKSIFCFSHTSNKYYSKDNKVFFSPFQSAQYSIFLYYLSFLINKNNNEAHNLADKVYYLNKALNGVDLFYEVELPNIFMTDHPVGSVIGRGIFNDYFSFSHGCTVGNNKGIYPSFGSHVTLYKGATIIGNCKIGSNVIISANTYIKDTDIPSNVIVFGSSPNLVLKESLK